MKGDSTFFDFVFKSFWRSNKVLNLKKLNGKFKCFSKHLKMNIGLANGDWRTFFKASHGPEDAISDAPEAEDRKFSKRIA